MPNHRPPERPATCPDDDALVAFAEARLAPPVDATSAESAPARARGATGRGGATTREGAMGRDLPSREGPTTREGATGRDRPSRGPMPPAAIEEHIDGCERCRELVGHLAAVCRPAGASSSGATTRVEGVEEARALASADARPAIGERIGRYLVLREAGSGGMGVVFAAYDPELDRNVALKVLRYDVRRGPESAARERLVREARAMARLAHPHVISVFDVGTFGPSVFIAMEFVDGGTLRGWLDDEPRELRAILDAFAKAGRGLAAAHAAGIVHRDFKPDNVLVSRDGRVLVTDFGLAREPEGPRDALDDLVPPRSARPSLTGTGTVLGTPAYMAPEQHRGENTDARTDQFGFSVALYRAVYGERPFAGSDVETIAASVVRGEVRAAPAGSRVPAHVRAALLRGMSVAPDARFPSMDALLDAVLRDPTVARRRRWTIALVAASLIAVVALLVTRPRAPAPLCPTATGELAGIWDDARRAEVARAFQAASASMSTPHATSASTSAPRATSTIDVARVAGDRLDRYAAAWVAASDDACTATRVRGTQSDEVLSLRSLCLARSRRALDEVTRLFVVADIDIVNHAIDAVDALPGIDGCSAVTVLRSRLTPPAASAAVAVEEVRLAIVGAEATYAAGRWIAARTSADAALARARTLDYRPLLAEALLAHGTMELDGAVAEKALLDALWSAEASRHDPIAARAWVALLELAERRDRPVDADFWASRAGAAIARIDGEPRLEADLDAALAGLRFRRGDLAGAADLYASAIRRRADAGEADTRAQVDLILRDANALAGLGRLADARAALRDADLRAARILTEGDPDRGIWELQSARIDYEEGAFDDATDHLARAYAIVEREARRRETTPAPPAQSDARSPRGDDAGVDASADPDATFDDFEASLDRMGELVQLDAEVLVLYRQLGAVAMQRGDVALAAGRAGDAEVAYRDAQRITTAHFGRRDVWLVDPLLGLARAARTKGDRAAALARDREAVALAEGGVTGASTDRARVAIALVDLGETLLDSSHAADARAPLEQASRQLDRSGPLTRARARFLLARAIAGDDPARARTLATQAERDAIGDGRSRTDLSSAIRTFIANLR